MRKSVLSGAAALFLLAAGGAFAADKIMDCCKDCKCCEKKADEHKGHGGHDAHKDPAPAPKPAG